MRKNITMKIFFLFILSFIGLFSMQYLVEKNSSGKIKNLIVIIGDGMGPQQVGLLEAYARQSQNPVIKNRRTAFTRLLDEGGVLGISMTNAANVLVTDSAAAATQIASGKTSGSEMIGIGTDGKPLTSILNIAKNMGKSTGLVSDVRITHATTAAFAAHQPQRSMENEIAEDMLATGPDVMLSGGLKHWIPKQANDQNSDIYHQLKKMTQSVIKIESKRTDNKNLLQEASSLGYQIAFTKSQLEKADHKILGLFSNSALPDAIITNRLSKDKDNHLPTLKEMSAKAVNVLSQNDQGFFLVIEAGLIDWAAHLNDTGTLLHEMIKINTVIDYILDWAQNRDDTLILVTADHETGGFGFSYSAANLPVEKKFPGNHYPDINFKPLFNYGDPSVLDKIYAQKSSYSEIFSDKFDALSKEQQTPLQLMKIINNNTEFDITEVQAERILAMEKNPYYVKNHNTLGNLNVPEMPNNDAFFVYQMGDNRLNLLAIEVAEKQSVVWSNGTHTASPVLIFAAGDPVVTAPFIGIMDHPTLGQKMIDILSNLNQEYH